MGEPTKQRKRRAVSTLRDVAEDLGFSPAAWNRSKQDVKASEFDQLKGRVWAAATPEQRERVKAAARLFSGEDPLPAVPTLPGASRALPAAAPQPAEVAAVVAAPGAGEGADKAAPARAS